MKVVILAGGKGTRFSGLTEFVPKPLIDVNGKPIITRIVEHYSHHGFKDFIIPVGYKGEMIKAIDVILVESINIGDIVLV